MSRNWNAARIIMTKTYDAVSIRLESHGISIGQTDRFAVTILHSACIACWRAKEKRVWPFDLEWPWPWFKVIQNPINRLISGLWTFLP